MADQQKMTSAFGKWRTLVNRLGLLGIFTVLFLLFAVTSSSSSQQTNLNSNSNGEEALDTHEAPAEQKYESKKPSYMFSIPDLMDLVEHENQLYGAMTTYLSHVESRIQKIKWWVKDYEESTMKAVSQLVKNNSTEPVVKNPFVSHRMVRRFSKDLKTIVDLLNPHPEQSLLKVIAEADSELPYPDVEEDYVDSMDSLLRIQHYNNYTTQDMQKGKLGHLETNITLDYLHACDLAMLSYFHMLPNNIRTLGIEWVEMALKLYEEKEIVDEKFEKKIARALPDMVKLHDEAWDSHRHKTTEWLFDDKIREDFGSHLPQRPRYKRDFEAMLHRSKADYSVHTSINFRTLCSGHNLQTEAEKAKLTCWYDRTTHPYWAINPLKKEALSLEPELYQMYDILSPAAISYLIGRAAPSMERSLVINQEDPSKSHKSSVRTSSQTWLFEYDFDPKLTEISKRIEYSSGINLIKGQFSQPLQVASYGGSHHYDEHMDVSFDARNTRESGHRIATYMFYLNNVEIGGKTAFPIIGTAATPVAGSAVMWYNVKKNGNPDYRMYHGGCPVVYGEKWVGNKWILGVETWNKRPCSLNSEE